MHKAVFNHIRNLRHSQIDADNRGDHSLARLLLQSVYQMIADDEEKYRPVEVHVTVAPTDIEVFTAACREVNVKPLILLLHDQHGGVIQEDMLTACRANSIDHGFKLIDQMKLRFPCHGLDVIREKIEIHPHAEEVYPPTEYQNNTMYLESHVDVKVDFTKHNMGKLFGLLAEHKAMPSSNISKLDTIIATVRAFEGGMNEIMDSTTELILALRREGFDVGDSETEMAVFDSNFYHDRKWAEVMRPHG